MEALRFLLGLFSRWDNKSYCIICVRPTGYTKDTPIVLRPYYVPGLGELCPGCHAFVEPSHVEPFSLAYL